MSTALETDRTITATGHTRQRKMLQWLVLVIVVALLVLVLVYGYSARQATAPAYWPTQSWQSGTPEEQGIDSAKLAAGLLAMREQNINIHSLLAIRNGKVVVDASFYPYDGKTVHNVASVTKSIMTTLIAIAADQGKLTLDAPLVSFFPERTIANRDARKEQITVRHLASMANGLESLCFANDEGTLREMQTTPDWVQFALDRKMSYAPGTHFCYDSPGMHLLSAILQQASGMTALDFARQNLFEPLGIDEVIWPSDPQGFNHGWGDLYLHHHDMAKIGYLWLNQGVWEGKQIVSRAWVEESVKPQINIDEEDDYGYGWWVPTSGGTYKASGRGGQVINVAPALNALVVTTGGGFEYDEIDPFLIAALVDPSKALPANPTGVAQLNAALTAVVQPPPPTAVAPLPATAQTITGKTFVFAPNPTQMETMRIEFDDTAEASLHITYAGSDQMVTWPVGLDGVYHFFTGKYDLPQGLRGTWVDEQTFVCEYDNIANNDHAQLRFHFDGDRVAVEVQETAHELGVQFEGKLQEP